MSHCPPWVLTGEPVPHVHYWHARQLAAESIEAEVHEELTRRELERAKARR